MSPPADESPQAAAWAAYWASPQRRADGGCLSAATPDMARVMDLIWTGLGETIPINGVVLDLATGNGIVLARLRQTRPDLTLTGIDSAPSLPPAPPGVELKAGVTMERLPFSDAAFDAVTSQFGIEYGDVAAAAREIARVSRTGASCTLLVHHAESQVVAHNKGRRKALAWAAFGSGYLEAADAYLADSRGIGHAIPKVLRDAPSLARRLFPEQSVAAEFVMGLRQCVENPRLLPHMLPGQALVMLRTKARHEIARIEALERAARDEAGIAALCGILASTGYGCAPPQPVFEYEKGGPALAWLINARKD